MHSDKKMSSKKKKFLEMIKKKKKMSKGMKGSQPNKGKGGGGY
jgi:hypothetical protein